MSEHIDPKFITMILDGHREGTLKVEVIGEGANLKFPYLSSSITMHLGVSNWEIVREALENAGWRPAEPN